MMTIINGFNYLAEIKGVDSTEVHQSRLMVSDAILDPLIRCAHFNGIRQERMPATISPPNATIAPCWDSEKGAPFFESIEIGFEQGNWTSEHNARASILPLVMESASSLVRSGDLQEGEQYHYTLLAYPAKQSRAAQSHCFEMEPEDTSLPIRALSKPDLVTSAEAVPITPKSISDEHPVVIHQKVIDDSIALAQSTPEVETGGMLVGYLGRDQSADLDSSDLVVEVTAMIPINGEATSTSLRFSPLALTEAGNVLTLRGKGEVILGWVHSHPPLL